jgi:D-glycero-D-manno-heptose 1,7-bisphosphate phosphatase
MLVLLDRDGVVNDDAPDYIKSPDAWKPIAGSLAAIATLNRSGHTVVVCTNQSAVGRRYMTEAMLGRIHEKLRCTLAGVGGHLDALLYCPHAPEAACDCRKPKPGLLLAARARFPAAAARTIVVGDSLRDMSAALAAGCTPVLVRTGNGSRDESSARELGVRDVFADLEAAVEWMLA